MQFRVGLFGNPVVYAAIEKIVKRLYPDGGTIPSGIKVVGRQIAKNHLKMKDFDEETFVGRNTYGSCLYGAIPSHQKADQFFNEKLKLNYQAGDSVILVGEITDKCGYMNLPW